MKFIFYKTVKEYSNSRLDKTAKVFEGVLEGLWNQQVYEVVYYEGIKEVDRFTRDTKELAILNAKTFVSRKKTYRIASL